MASPLSLRRIRVNWGRLVLLIGWKEVEKARLFLATKPRPVKTKLNSTWPERPFKTKPPEQFLAPAAGGDGTKKIKSPCD
jgi:hypothetical protein